MGGMSNVWIEGFRNADTRKETPSLLIMSQSQPHQTAAPIGLSARYGASKELHHDPVEARYWCGTSVAPRRIYVLDK